MNDSWPEGDGGGDVGPAAGGTRRSGRRRSTSSAGRGRSTGRSSFGDGRGGRSAPGRGAGRDSDDEQPGAPSTEMDDPETVARGICLRALTGTPKTRQQLAELLARKDVPADAAAAVLDRFTEVGLIDDAAFAAAWVSSRQSGRGLAKRALTQELRAKGVDDEVAAAAVAEVDPQDEWDTARRLVERKAPAMRRLDRVTAERRLVGMLARKGYGGGLAGIVVREALDTAVADGPADEELEGGNDDGPEAVGGSGGSQAAGRGFGGGGGAGGRGFGGGGAGGRGFGGGGFGSGAAGRGGFGGRKPSGKPAGGKPNGGGLGGGGGIAGQRAAEMADEVGEGYRVPIGRRAEPPADHPH